MYHLIMKNKNYIIYGFFVVFFIWVEILSYAQFHVKEKVEIFITYGENNPEKIKNILISNKDNNISYSGMVDPVTGSCTLYDVEPGTYSLSLDSGDKIFLSRHVYSIRLSEDSSKVYSTLYYENEIELRSERNLKIFITFPDQSNNRSGIEKIKEVKTNNFDSVYFEYFGSGDMSTNASASTGEFQKVSVNQALPVSTQTSTILRSSADTTLTLLYSTQEPNFYYNYSGLLGNVQTSMSLTESDIKRNDPSCEKIKIKNVQIYYYKRPTVSTGMNPGEFGKVPVDTFVIKGLCTVTTNDCTQNGQNCTCKFDADLGLGINYEIRIRTLEDTQNMLGKAFYVPCIVNNQSTGNKAHITTSQNAGNFRKAIMDHEQLHVIQYQKVAEGLFKGTLGNTQGSPFYFNGKPESEFILWDNTKTLADKICENIDEVKCGCNGQCEKEKCVKEETKVLEKVVKQLEKLVEKKFKQFASDILELPCWHFTFLKFNEYDGVTCK